MISYFTSAIDLADFDDRVRHLTDGSDLTSALAPIAEHLPLPTAELIELCHRNTSLSELRDGLSLDFQEFNAAIAHADPEHPPLTHPDDHSRALSDYVEKHRTAIVNRLREAYAPNAQPGADLRTYAAARNLEGLSPDPGWLSQYATPPEDLIAAHVANWLHAHDADSDLTAISQLTPLDELRRRNFEALEKLLAEAEPRVRAWCRRHGRSLPSAWRAPLVNGRTALETSQLADFYVISTDIFFTLLIDELGWPEGMPPNLELSQLGLTEDDLLAVEDRDPEETERVRYERSHITVDGCEIPVSADDLAELAESVARTTTEETLSQSAKLALKIVPPSGPKSSGAGSGKKPVATAVRRDLSEEQRTAIGLIGEVTAKLWLERHYPQVEWVSAYRNIIDGGTAGSDAHGFDFRVQTASGKTRYIEVKAFTADISAGAEFMLGETEVRAAQEHGNNYQVLLVSEARDSARRRIFPVPNPLASAGRGRFSLIGKGLRYSCQFDHSR